MARYQAPTIDGRADLSARAMPRVPEAGTLAASTLPLLLQRLCQANGWKRWGALHGYGAGHTAVGRGGDHGNYFSTQPLLPSRCVRVWQARVPWRAIGCLHQQVHRGSGKPRRVQLRACNSVGRCHTHPHVQVQSHERMWPVNHSSFNVALASRTARRTATANAGPMASVMKAAGNECVD